MRRCCVVRRDRRIEKPKMSEELMRMRASAHHRLCRQRVFAFSRRVRRRYLIRPARVAHCHHHAGLHRWRQRRVRYSSVRPPSSSMPYRGHFIPLPPAESREFNHPPSQAGGAWQRAQEAREARANAVRLQRGARARGKNAARAPLQWRCWRTTGCANARFMLEECYRVVVKR